MNTRLITPFIALLLLAGCGGKAKTPTATKGGPVSPVIVTPGTTPGTTPLTGITPDIPEIPEKGSEGWKPAPEAKLAAVDVASKMDAALRGLRNVTCVATIVGETSKGRIMPSTFPTSIRDAKTFEIAFMRLSNGVPGTGYAKADGSRVTVLEPTGYTKARPVGVGRKRDSEALVDGWAMTFPQQVFNGLVDGGDLFKTLISGWKAGTHGYQMEIEERVTPYNGKEIKNYRILAERPLRPGRVETVEIVIDGNLFLPVTIRSQAWDERGNPTSFQWSAEWKNNQKLDPKKFVVGQK